MLPRRLVNLSVILLFFALSCNYVQSLNPSGENPAALSGALLNEVLFLPSQGKSAFVELKSSGGRVPLGGLYLINESGATYTLPGGVNDLASNQFLLILFDGTNKVEDKTVHADQTAFVNPESGFLELHASDRTLLDRVAWGESQPGSVRLSRGGKIPDFLAGTTIGRIPTSVESDPLQWVAFAPDEATPGAANPNPGVTILLPLTGAVLDQSNASLSWYPVPGAAQYRVQVSTEETFKAAIIDQTVTAPPLKPDSLQPGTYFWRVQAISSDGSTSEYSLPNSFTLIAKSASTPHLAAPSRVAALPVPWIGQHKDTQMLELEVKNETGAHAWDVDHQVLDMTDPADNMNCSQASIAMVTSFYGGKLSQDRIGYEVFKDVKAGPEWDLNYGRGLSDKKITFALTFALGAAPTYRPAPATPTVLWGDVKKEIDAGRPLIASTPSHVFVITGYNQVGAQQLITVNDPWVGTYQIDIINPQGSALGNIFDTYWLMPAAVQAKSDEPGISQDSDGDGVVDFDETERFGTDPNNPDTDGDKVKDKDEIRASVFDTKHGYAVGSIDHNGRDFDGDKLAMELDPDSDGGGCLDGMEDLNYNGKFDPSAKELYNFDKKDDVCLHGTYEFLQDVNYTTNGDQVHTSRTESSVFSLRPIGGGKLEGRISATHTEIETVVVGGACAPQYQHWHPARLTWGSDLVGTYFKNPDGTVKVTMRPLSGRSPSWSVSIDGGCTGGTGPVPAPGIYLLFLGEPGITFLLKDGLYDFRYDIPPAYNATGPDYMTWHVEQSQNK
jgi:hypothetical protein